jgi:hypothetical protein
MVDEGLFRSTYHAVNQNRCAFEKSILSRRSACSRCKRFRLADREGAACTSPAARERCLWILELLRERARFALKLSGEEESLPFNKEMKVQTGGMLALQAIMDESAQELSDVRDIYALISSAEERYESLESLPFSQIMTGISAFEIRKRRKRRD